MRFTGLSEADRGPRSHAHLCLSYTDPADLQVTVVEFLADGLRRGQQVRYVSQGTVGDLTTHLTGLPETGDAIDRGALQVVSLDDMYRYDVVVDPPRQVAAYAAATEQALVEGYTGLRVVAEATPLVRTAPQLDAFARYEHLVDRYMVSHPFSALCAYDQAELGDAAIAQLACMHPAASPGATMFHLHPAGRHDLILSGELDMTSQDLLQLALRRTLGAQPDIETVVIDASQLTFIDHRSLIALDVFAREHGVQVHLVGVPASTPAQIAALLRLSSLHVETAA